MLPGSALLPCINVCCLPASMCVCAVMRFQLQATAAWPSSADPMLHAVAVPHLHRHSHIHVARAHLEPALQLPCRHLVSGPGQQGCMRAAAVASPLHASLSGPQHSRTPTCSCSRSVDDASFSCGVAFPRVLLTAVSAFTAGAWAWLCWSVLQAPSHTRQQQAQCS
jgi:hypothetical protein